MPTISGCFSEFTKFDKVCNGDKESLDSEDRKPCEWKARCKAFKRYLSENKKTIDLFLVKKEGDEEADYIAKHGFPQFASFCDRLIERYKPDSKKKKKKKDKRSMGPTPAAMKAAAKALTERAKKRGGELVSWIYVFIEDFSNRLKNHQFAMAGIAIPHGTFYLIDHLKRSRYISIAYRSCKGHDFILARIILKPLLLKYEIRSHLSVEDWSKIMSESDFKKYNPEAFTQGKICSIIRRIDKKQLAYLSGILARGVNKGMILPKEDMNA